MTRTHWYISVLLSLLPSAAVAVKTHQFRFVGSNVAYGDVPKIVHILGYWYVHEGNRNFGDLFKAGYSPENLRGQLYVCRKGIERKMLLINESAEKNKTAMINLMLGGKSEERFIKPYIDPSGCEMLETRPDKVRLTGADVDVQVHRFDITHNFTAHGPILFVDTWGVAAFHYRAKASDAEKIHYCENDDVTFPVIFNKRPVCPRPAIKSTIVDPGKVTVYKPNIQAAQKVAYQCYLEAMYVYTDTGFLNTRSNNIPLTKEVWNKLTVDLCETWIRTKSCETSGIHRHLEWIDFDPKMKKVSETRWATTNAVKLRYKWMQSQQYYVVNCILDVGYIRTSAPFKTLLTPWVMISNEYLYLDTFKRIGGEIVKWEAFQKDEICSYVPINSMNAKRITYNSKDYLEQDPHTDATEMYQFVSDAEKSVYMSDDTQVVDNRSLNCVIQESGQVVYAINNGMLISWQKDDSINEIDDDVQLNMTTGEQEFHPHFAYNDLTEELHGNHTSIFTIEGGSDGAECDPEVNDACRQSRYVRRRQEGRNESISNSNFLNKKRQQTANEYFRNATSNLTDTPLFAVVAYLRHNLETFKNEEIVRRAQVWCENQQHFYDIQMHLATIDPSMVISSYLNRPAKAKAIGSGVFATHYCDTINDYVVVDNLFVDNDAVAPRMGGKVFSDIYKELGVPVSKNKCFTMPIIIFKDQLSTDRYRIGQLMHDQSVSTIKMPFVEDCKIERYFLHKIGDFVHVFLDYRKVDITPLKELYDHANRVRKTAKKLDQLNHGGRTNRRSIHPLLENTLFVDIYTKYSPKAFKKTFIGFQNTQLYGYREQRRVINSLEGALGYVNNMLGDNKLLRQLIGPTKHTKVDKLGGIARGVSHFGMIVGEGVRGGVKFVADGIGDGVDFVVDKAGETVSGILGKTSDTLGSVANMFTGGFMKIIIIIAAVCVVALLLYMLVKHKLLADDDENATSCSKPPLKGKKRKTDKMKQFEMSEF